MDKRESPSENSQASSYVKLNLDKLPDDSRDRSPFNFLTPRQKRDFQQQAEARQYDLGTEIWSTEGLSGQFLILSGKIRLSEIRLEESTRRTSSHTLKTGDWFGDLLELSGQFKAVASSQSIIVIYWDAILWDQVSSAELSRFWTECQERYQTQERKGSYPVSKSDYPFVPSQNSAAACLTMAARFLQVPAQLGEIQQKLRSQKPSDVSDVAEKFGIQLRQLQVEWDDLRQLDFPLLLRWQNNSWITVYGVRGNRLIIANPLLEEEICESVPQSIIEAEWDGQVWQVERPEQKTFNLSWFLPAVLKHRRLLGEVLLASLTLQLLGLATPILTQVIIDKALLHKSISTLDVMAIGLLGVAVFEAVLGTLRIFIFTHTTNRLDLGLSAQLFRHLMRLPLAYFEARRVGDTVARVQELENIRQFLTGTALTVVLDSTFSVIYLGIMFTYSATLTWVALAVIPFFAGVTLFTTPRLRHWLNETFNRGADSQSFLVDTVNGIQAVKAHAAERTNSQRWEGLFARYVRTGFKASTVSNIGGHIGEFLTHLSYLLILWFGARLVMEQKLTIGGLVAFQMLSARVADPLVRLVQLWQEFQQVLLSVDRLGDILNTSPEAEAGAGNTLPSLRGQVTFEQVFFRYKKLNLETDIQTEPILKGISFTVEPGMFVGIVGRSGSGKSTLSKLLQRLYPIDSGSIRVDDFDIKTVNLTFLRQQISVVLQDDFLFNGSVAENIRLGNEEISDEQMFRAARLAAADEFISKLSQGYDTHLGERGVALSGGQRQRIALARLFLSEAPILILDEATSSLDSETEQQVLQNLQQVSRNRTVFMVAHHFAPLKQADLILVLDQGVLMEQGNHEELLQRRGVYWALYQRQQSS